MAAIIAPYSTTNASSPLTPRQLSHTGPYDPVITSSPLLANHTIYQPANLTAITKAAPVVVWGNNACNATTSTDPYATLNLELASWGMLILSCGSPVSAFSALAQHAGAAGAWKNVSKEVGVLGTSCSGVGLLRTGREGEYGGGETSGEQYDGTGFLLLDFYVYRSGVSRCASGREE
ncbi:hypothetical protein SLS59_008720 [Nothophoma quercina]|uniref:Uncharacterized protein n=1 Tax=Nothophoma quercina TaxID=749835 RepID=A0ABR3QR98_9PLEO